MLASEAAWLETLTIRGWLLARSNGITFTHLSMAKPGPRRDARLMTGT